MNQNLVENIKYLPYHFPVGSKDIFESHYRELYSFVTYIGKHKVSVELGGSAWYYHKQSPSSELLVASSVRGPREVDSRYCCTVMKGYAPQDRSAVISTTNLPYVNGCSTESLLPPIRLGDPTLQILYMPPNSSEQQHHIHSTVRVVFVLAGAALNIYGMDEINVKEIQLNAGDVLILDKMLPHHFITLDLPLVCSPFHVFSSIGGGEQNHPMFNGTHMTDTD